MGTTQCLSHGDFLAWLYVTFRSYGCNISNIAFNVMGPESITLYCDIFHHMVIRQHWRTATKFLQHVEASLLWLVSVKSTSLFITSRSRTSTILVVGMNFERDCATPINVHTSSLLPATGMLRTARSFSGSRCKPWSVTKHPTQVTLG